MRYCDFSISPIWRPKWLLNERRKLRGYWTKVYQIFTRCRKDFKNASIRLAILLSVVERDSQEGKRVADFGQFLPICRLKLVAMATSLGRSRNEYQIEHLYIVMSTNPENLLKVALVGSEICLFQAVVKKER